MFWFIFGRFFSWIHSTGFAATTLPRSLKICSFLDKVHIKFGDPLFKPFSIPDSGLKSFFHFGGNLVELSLVEWFLYIDIFINLYFVF